MNHKTHIARIIDLGAAGVTFFSGPDQYTIEWPQDSVGDAPQIGDVYELTLTPTVTVQRKLATALPDVDWPNSDTMRWRKPTSSGKTRIEVLQQRHLIKRAVRDYLHEQDFVEIDMPLLVPGTTPDAEIDSFAAADRYLVTSCEYQIKRMEIGGFDRLYSLTQNFRVGDKGRTRNPEFTMIEWARVGQTLKDIEDDAEQFLIRAHKALHGDAPFVYQGQTIDISTPWHRISVRDAIAKYMGVALDDFTIPSLLKAVAVTGLEANAEQKADAVFLFSLVLDHLQTKLGFDKPVFLTEWPTLMTSSADLDASGQFTQRSELFIAGVELSDGFPSLTDYERQNSGFQEQLDRRKEHGFTDVAIDHKYLETMREGFASGAGMALGFDRLVMLLTDQPILANVLAFGWDEL